MAEKKIYWFVFQGDHHAHFQNGFIATNFNKAEEQAVKFSRMYGCPIVEYTGWTLPEDPELRK